MPIPSPYRLGRPHAIGALELPVRVTPLLPPGLGTRTRRACARQPPCTYLRASWRPIGGSGISTRCPSPTTFVLGLGPTNPEMIGIAQETLGLRRVGFSPTLRYSCRHSHFRPLQPSSRSTFTANRTLPYHPPAQGRRVRSFGTRLEPRWIFGADPLDQ